MVRPVELSARDTDEVIAALGKWTEGLDKADADYEHRMMEALWVQQWHNRVNETLLKLDKRNVAGVITERNTAGQPTTFFGSPDTIVEQVKRCSDEMGAGVIDFFFQNAYSSGPDAWVLPSLGRMTESL